MNSLLPYAGALVAGGAVGTFFFWGLWFSLQLAGKRENKALFLIGSFVLRSAVVLAAMLAVLRLTGAYGLVAFMVGFLVSRIVVTRSVRRSYD